VDAGRGWLHTMLLKGDNDAGVARKGRPKRVRLIYWTLTSTMRRTRTTRLLRSTTCSLMSIMISFNSLRSHTMKRRLSPSNMGHQRLHPHHILLREARLTCHFFPHSIHMFRAGPVQVHQGPWHMA